MLLRRSLRIGPISHVITPSMSWCIRCRTTWRFVRPHLTGVTDSSGVFALCDRCWFELDPEERLPYYLRASGEWEPEILTRLTQVILAGG
jgi:hypothetical protein